MPHVGWIVLATVGTLGAVQPPIIILPQVPVKFGTSGLGMYDEDVVFIVLIEPEWK